LSKHIAFVAGCSTLLASSFVAASLLAVHLATRDDDAPVSVPALTTPSTATAPASATAAKPTPTPSLESLKAIVSAASLRSFHDLLGSEPHIAGTPGDARQIERLATAFSDMGLATRIEPFWAMLPAPIAASLEITEGDSPRRDSPPQGQPPEGQPPKGAQGGQSPGGTVPKRRGVLSLSLRESNLLEDPATAHPDLTWGWNAYSGSGEVTAGVVFANRGTLADFARLHELGIDITGKIALIRYGGIFRGSKVRNAQDAGAAAVLLYTDPADSGIVRGAVWPDGGWANDHCIQRGSVVTLEQPGDPLTPFIPATRDAPRLDPATVDLPRIPVQPIGYAAAAQIVARMTGAEIAKEDPWHGGIAAPYRFEGGPDLTLKLVVKQDREIRESANVIAVLPGSRWPEQAVIVGCHHDAWGFGAADPLAGTIVLMEMARAFSERAAAGERPLRTIIFAAWGAEEYGIIGSVEWVEAHREAIAAQAVAYLNLDMASMGPKLGAAASPALREVVLRVTGVENVGDPGGGSDHVGFLHHLAIPSVGISASGSAGDSYHSNYDTVAWYRKTVGDDYASASLVTNASLALVSELASARVLPLRAAAIGRAVERWGNALKKRTDDAAQQQAIDSLIMRGQALADLGARLDERLDELAAAESAPDAPRLETPRLETPQLDAPHLDSPRLDTVNRLLMSLERAWYDHAGLPSRPWTRNLALAADRQSGYGATVLPLVAEALQNGDAAAFAEGVERTADALDRLGSLLQELEDALHPELP